MIKSKIIFENTHYTACAMRDDSLIVQSKRKNTGKRLLPPQAAEWINHIQTAIDNHESAALCRAILQN